MVTAGTSRPELRVQRWRWGRVTAHGEAARWMPQVTCSVTCRYFLNGSSEVGSLLAELAGFGPQARQPPAEPPDPDEEPEESDND